MDTATVAPTKALVTSLSSRTSWILVWSGTVMVWRRGCRLRIVSPWQSSAEICRYSSWSSL